MNNNRLLVIIAAMTVFFTVLAAKLFDIQINMHEDYAFYAKNQQTEIRNLRAERGFIYDRNNELIAYDRNDVSFFADTRMLKKDDAEKIAAKFSEVFGKSKNHYLKILKGKSKIVTLEEKAPREKSHKLKSFTVEGVFSKEDPTRIYSYDNLASHLIGYVDKDYKGVEGIEKFYDEKLKGVDGKVLIRRDVRGRMLSIAEDATVKPKSGNSVVLTINKTYQKILQEELQKGVEQYKANSAVGIIMNPNNGEVLAFANLPDFNPNKFNYFSNESRRNKALTDTYEPGSTFKSIIMAALIDKGVVKENEKVYAENGKYRYKRVNISDSHKHEWLTSKEVIEQSSNIGMAKFVQRIDKSEFFKYLRDFGFGNYTSIDLPGETKGKLLKPAQFDDYSQMSMSYGYGISITPMQLTAAYCALVNGGTLYQPYLLKKVISREGNMVENANPKPIRKVISTETSNIIKDFMLGVVENGTAKTAKIEGVKVGGKTGTSKQLENNKYSANSYNSSFAGFFPVDNPQIVCFILMDSPQLGRYGGLVAAPVFKSISEKIIEADPNLMRLCKQNYLESDPQTNEVILASNDDQDQKEFANFTEKVNKEMIAQKQKIADKTKMPNLTNYQLRDAISVLTQLGLKYKVQGSGKVVSQSILPDQKIKPGEVCILKCESKKLDGVIIN